ncbi:preprotein translocase subunit SecD [Actinomadura rubteroloni]|uniref:Protein translocase subunit SecD n=1 Tax=Actinomadura rubteroloni TaxID=1926885 RepID=A0A2P4UDV0_9ACTN|nr:protein translocase subunit SecD [Actinomadura rubteroloni]POM23225.1 preprotein translocase subunit SecD [Actinomadura rubteroloni]
MFAVLAALTGVMFLQGRTTPKLGLDLAGGTTVTLTAKTERGKNPPASQMDQAIKIINQRVNGLGVSDAEVAKQGSNNIVVNVPGEGQSRVVGLIGTTAKLQFRQVFAVTDGKPIQLKGATPDKGAKPTASPSATPSSSVSASPSATPRGRALSGALALPTPLASPSATKKPSASPSASPSATPTAATTPPTLEELRKGLSLPAGVSDEIVRQFATQSCYGTDRRAQGSNDPNRAWVVSCDQQQESGAFRKYILGPVAVHGEEVASADAIAPNAQNGTASWSVALKFKHKGADQFAKVTGDAYKAASGTPQRQVAIVLDGQVVSAPSIDNGAISGGTASIYGSADSFTQSYASDLANVLKYGALPLEFKQSSIDEVSSTLGSDQLSGGLIAGAIGLALVVVYCMLYYRGLGLVAVSSLIVAAVITYVSVVILGENIGFRLSLPHIIGLIVSIGITADSFIVYFERLRDELRAGRRLRPSVEAAWKRARRTILVADAVTFIAALVLYFLAVGGVAGFAFAMGLTTLIDVVVVFFFTKPLVTLLSRTSFYGRGHPWSGLDPRKLHKPEPATATARPTGQEA